jgi:hypothetical protein
VAIRSNFPVVLGSRSFSDDAEFLGLALRDRMDRRDGWTEPPPCLELPSSVSLVQ